MIDRKPPVSGEFKSGASRTGANHLNIEELSVT